MAFFPKLTGESQRSYLLNAHFASLCFHFKQSHWTVPSSFNPVGQGAEVISAGSGSADTPSDFHFCQTIVFSLCKEYLQEGKTWKGQIIIFLGCIEREKKVMNLPRSMKVLLHYRKPVFTYKKRCKVWIWRCRVVMTKHLVGVGEKPQEQPMYFQRDKKERKKKRTWQFVLAGWLQKDCDCMWK